MTARTAAEVGQLLNGHREAIRREYMRLSLLDSKIQGNGARVWMPKGADGEYRDLMAKARGPWLEFGADAITQGIRIDGCNSDDVWQVWQDNGLDGRQNGVTRDAVRFGSGWVLVLPSSTVETYLDEDSGEEYSRVVRARGPEQHPVIRPLGALNTYAHFADDWAERPDWVLVRLGGTRFGDFWESQWMLVDDQAVYRFSGSAITPGVSQGFNVFEHEMGYTPVSRIANTLPTSGRPASSVERAIPVYLRIVDATFTMEMVQRYGAFPQKWAAGGTLGSVNVSSDSLIHAGGTEGETARFGNFDAANLTDVAAAKDSHVKDLAAMIQVPPHYLLGAVVNMSAEGIAAAESGYFRNIGERQDSHSEGWELAMRDVGGLLELDPSEVDQIQMHFEDVSSRSLAQIADALTKLDTLGLPREKAFALVPGFTQLDAQQAARAATREAKAAQKRQLAIASATPAESAATPESAPTA